MSKYETLEQRAFMLFNNHLFDDFKRLLMLRIYQAVVDNPNITTNKLYHSLKRELPVQRQDFDAGVIALEKVMLALSLFEINHSSKGGKSVTHLNVRSSSEWLAYMEHVREKPSLRFWVGDADAAI